LFFTKTGEKFLPIGQIQKLYFLNVFS